MKVSFRDKYSIRFHGKLLSGKSIGVYYTIHRDPRQSLRDVWLEVFIEKTRKLCNNKWRNNEKSLALKSLSLEELHYVLDSYNTVIRVIDKKHKMENLLAAEISACMMEIVRPYKSEFNKLIKELSNKLFDTWGGVRPLIPSIRWVPKAALWEEKAVGLYDFSRATMYVAIDDRYESEIISTFIHELRHHWQYENGTVFNSTLPYWDRPYEVDARWAQAQPVPQVDINYIYKVLSEMKSYIGK